MSTQQIAKTISVIFGIRVLPFFLIALILLKSGLTTSQLLLIAPITIFLLVIIPVLYIYLAIKHKKAGNWDLSNREERYGFVVTTLISGIICLGFVYFFANPLLFHLNLVSIITLLIIGLITRFWKISFHASLITITVILTNFLFGWSLLFLSLLIPIVLWARYTLKHHTLAQLLAGSLISGGITLGALKLFGYL